MNGHAGYNPILCGSCAVVRWLRVLDVAVTKISTAAMADAVGNATTVTADSTHPCRSTRTMNEATFAVPWLPPINQGCIAVPPPADDPAFALPPKRDLLAGTLVVHQTLPVPSDARSKKTKGSGTVEGWSDGCTTGPRRNGPGQSVVTTCIDLLVSTTSCPASTSRSLNCNSGSTRF